MKYNNKVSAATIARTAALLLALANQILSAFGKSPLPIESSTVEQLVTTGITTVTALINWWYNNSFTQAAIEGDKTYENVKNQQLPHNSTSLPVFLAQEGREALFLLPFFAISSPETHLKRHFRRGYSRKKTFSGQKCTF